MKKIKISAFVLLLVGAFAFNVSMLTETNSSVNLRSLFILNEAQAETTVQNASPDMEDCQIGLTVLGKSFLFNMERTNCPYTQGNPNTCTTESCLDNLQRVGGALVGVMEGFTQEVWEAIKRL